MSSIQPINTAPTFIVSSGIVTTNFSQGSADSVTCIAIQPDGKIILGGVSYTNSSLAAIARYNTDGSLDKTFSEDGKLLLGNGTLSSLTILENGKILASKNSTDLKSTDIICLNSDGTIDTSFSNDGIVTISGAINKILIQADKKILGVGASFFGLDGKRDILIYRLDSNGELDTRFDADGSILFDLGLDDIGMGAFILSNDDILISGYSRKSNNLSFAIIKLNPNGTFDTSFDNDGIVLNSIGTSEGWSVGNVFDVQSDGKMLMVAPYLNGVDYDFLLIRFNSNGSLDTTFSDDGKVTTDFGSQDVARSIAIQKDGKILVTGWGSNQQIAIARYNNDGSLDTTFNGDGKATVKIGKENFGLNIAIQDDGKIIISAEVAISNDSSTGNWWDFGLIRLNPDGSLDSTFSPPSITLDSISKYTEQYSPIVLDNNVQIFDAELASLNNYNGSSVYLSRDIISNSDDVFSSSRDGELSSLIENRFFSIEGITIGKVNQNSNGILELLFNDNASQILVNKTLQQIAYSNKSDNPPTVVKINWVFSDGNNGLQGTNGKLSTIGSTLVEITPINDAPYPISDIDRKEAFVGQLFSFTIPSSIFLDPDSASITYSAGMLDQTGIPPWLTFNNATNTFSGIPKSSDIGFLSLAIYATDNLKAKGQAPFYLNVLASDTTPPTISVSSSTSALTAGSSATITFALSEASSNFTSSDVTVTGGTLSNFSGSGTTYMALFTPTANSTTNGVVRVASGVFTDAAGNANADGSDANNTVTMTVDTVAPAIALSTSKASLSVGESSTLTFTLSEASTTFTASDVNVTGGALSNFAGSGTTYTALFTPTANSTTSGVIGVASGVFSDAAGNVNADGSDANNTLTITVNTMPVLITHQHMQQHRPPQR
jgi:uncharacterized delta-60 repeat protein